MQTYGRKVVRNSFNNKWSNFQITLSLKKEKVMKDEIASWLNAVGHLGDELGLLFGWMPPPWQKTRLCKWLKVLEDRVLLESPYFVFLSACFSYSVLKIYLDHTESEFGAMLCFYFIRMYLLEGEWKAATGIWGSVHGSKI